MPDLKVNNEIETAEGGYIRVSFDSNSQYTRIEVWDPCSEASLDGWVTLNLTPQNASRLKQLL